MRGADVITRKFLLGLAPWASLKVLPVLFLGTCGLAVAGVVGLAQEEVPQEPPQDQAEEALEAEGGFDETDSPSAESGEAAASAAAEAEQGPSLLTEFYHGITAENLRQKVEGLYTTSAVREDPIGSFEGRDRILAHYQNLFEGMSSLEVDVKDEFLSGDETIAVWQMRVKHAGLGSEPVVIDGVSHLRVQSGRIVFQRDYFDLGAAVYEHVTLVGSIVRWVKGKLLP
jgi:limonene-1,2-epoxide hydrolase